MPRSPMTPGRREEDREEKKLSGKEKDEKKN